MPKASKGKKFYAVQKGRQNGVFLTWGDCEKQTKGYPGAKYRSFANAADAEAFVNGTLSKDHGLSAPSTSSSPVLTALNSKGKKRALPSDVGDESTYDVVYCDGACKGNGQAGSIAGVGVWWEENDPRNIAERCPGDQTNNRAELIAIVRMLETTPESKRPLLIKTDSQYCIKCFLQWLPKWKRNNFRTAGGHAVKNVELIIYASALLEARALMGQPVRMEYVKGHSGDRGNDGADAQANKGALLPPVPERDWVKAKQELLERLEEERRLNESQPTSVPLNANVGVSELSTNQPYKVRKVDHDSSPSRLSLAPTSTALSSSEPIPTASSTTQVLSPSLPPSPHLPFPIIEVSSPENEPSQPQTAPSTAPASDHAQAESQSGNATVVTDTNFQISKHESNKSPRMVRKHGVGLFTTTPPPNAYIVRRSSTLHNERQGAERSKSVPQDQENDKKPMAMCVDVEDVDLDEGTKSESVTQGQEANEKQMVMSADSKNVDLDATKPESVAQDREENEKPMADYAADDDGLIEATKPEPATGDQEINEKPIMGDNGVIESKSVPKDQEESKKSMVINEDVAKDQKETKRSMTINEDVVDVDSEVEEVTESESVLMDQEETEKSMVINEDAADVGLEKAKDSVSGLNDKGKTEIPMAMGVDAADVDLIEVAESESVLKVQETSEISMTINPDTAKVEMTGPTELNDQQKIERPTEKVLAMSVDVSDIDLKDYLDCVDDDDDDPFDEKSK